MLAFQTGSKSAFETLMRNYYPRILNFIFKFLGDRQKAEDLTQEVFLRVYRHVAGYKPRSQFKTWLYTIARNICLNEMRRKKERIVSLDDPAGPDGRGFAHRLSDKSVAGPDEDLIRREKMTLVQAAVNELPEKQRAAVLLRRYEQMSYAEIAVTLNVSEKAVKSLLSRARQNLKNSLAGLVKETS